MSQTQLLAVTLARWLVRFRPCGCVAPPLAAALTCGLLLLRGVGALVLAADELEGALGGKWSPARVALLAAGAGDCAAAAAGLVGRLLQRGAPLVVLPAWLCLHVPLLVAFLFCSPFRIPGESAETWLGVAVEHVAGVLLLSLDLGLALVGIWVFLDTTMREALAPHAIQILVEAETLAWARADPSCDRRHLVVALLQSHSLRRLLSEAGADLPRMHTDLVAGQRDSEGAEDDPDVVVHLSDYCPLGHDLEATLHGAAYQQRLKGDDQLRLDHLVMSLWGSGAAAVELRSRQAGDVAGPGAAPPSAQYRLNVRHLEEQLHALKARAEQARLLKGPRGPVVLGCLPLEPVVAAYAAGRAVLATAATAWMLLTRTSAGAMVGLSTVPEMRWLELLVHAVSAVCAAAGVAGICMHRGGRFSILDAACEASGNEDIVLEEALDVVSDQKEAAEWLASLKRGASWLGLFLLWSCAELLLNIPIYCMLLVHGNVCGGYVYGLTSITMMAGSPPRSALMHCRQSDYAELIAGPVWLALKLYMCWAVLALWHRYAFGWTTTDFRASGYLEPYNPLSDKLTRALAGLPGAEEARMRLRFSGEARPLLL